MTDPFLDTLAADAAPAIGERVARVVAEFLAAASAGTGPVSADCSLSELAARFDEPVPASGAPLDQIVERVRSEILSHANRLAHPMAMGHQVSPPLPAAIWTDAIVAAMNQSLAVCEMSPTLSPVEGTVVRWLAELAGLGPRAGGTFTSGGTEATFTALLAARAAAVPESWTEGLAGRQAPVVVCGEHAHYAIARAVGQLGLGTRHLTAVPSRGWRMDVEALAAALDRLRADGRQVMAVVATAGSTPTGSFDDLDAIAQVCDRDGIWLHVDGAHGASALLSPAHRRRVRGIHRARTSRGIRTR